MGSGDGVVNAGGMSWAIYAMRGPGGIRRLEDVPDGYEPPSLGTAEQVLGLVREVVPDVDASNRSWLRLKSAEYDVELSIGKGVDVRDVTFYLNDGARSIPLVLQLSSRLGVTPYDTESGDFLTEESRPPVPPPLTPDEIKANKPKWWKLGRK